MAVGTTTTRAPDRASAGRDCQPDRVPFSQAPLGLESRRYELASLAGVGRKHRDDISDRILVTLRQPQIDVHEWRARLPVGAPEWALAQAGWNRRPAGFATAIHITVALSAIREPGLTSPPQCRTRISFDHGERPLDGAEELWPVGFPSVMPRVSSRSARAQPHRC